MQMVNERGSNCFSRYSVDSRKKKTVRLSPLKKVASVGSEEASIPGRC